MSQFPAALNLKEDDVAKLLACEAHLGTNNIEPSMARYVWRRRADGIYIINLSKTWEKLQLAARVIAAIENPADVCVSSARPWGQRAALKFASHIGAQAISGRFTPGTFTNQIQEKFIEPRLLILTDPQTDHQPIRESSYVNIPTVAFCHTDSPLKHVDIAIPCNNKGRHSIGLMYWLLAREVLRLRGVIPRNQPWNVMVDLFFYRDPDEVEKSEEAEESKQDEPAGYIGGDATWDTPATEGGWGPSSSAPTEWASEAAPAPAASNQGWDSIVNQGWEGQQPR
jgi:small subunit ribosomal protein SAe